MSDKPHDKSHDEPQDAAQAREGVDRRDVC